MSRHHIPLGRILGIRIGLDYSWFLIFALLTWLLARSYYPAEFPSWSAPLYWSLGALTAILLFVSVLLHELGHSVVALAYRVPVPSITLFVFGGVAELGAEPPSARAEFLIAVAGPLVSAALALGCYAIQPAVARMEPLLGLARYLTYINTAVVLFNLIPGYPLDGGRVFRAIIWAVTGSMRRATVVAASVGRFFGFAFIFLGVWQMFAGNLGDGLWIAFIGWFLESAAAGQVQQTLVHDLLAGRLVAHAMKRHAPTVPADLPLQRLVDEYILGGGQRAFLVNDAGRIIGLVTLHGVQGVPRAEWGRTTVRQVLLPLAQLKATTPGADIGSALEQMDRAGVNQLPVLEDGQVAGMLSREDVISFLRTLRALRA